MVPNIVYGLGLANHPFGDLSLFFHRAQSRITTRLPTLPIDNVYIYIYTINYETNIQQNLFYRHLQRNIRYNRATNNTTQLKNEATQISSIYHL